MAGGPGPASMRRDQKRSGLASERGHQRFRRNQPIPVDYYQMNPRWERQSLRQSEQNDGIYRRPQIEVEKTNPPTLDSTDKIYELLRDDISAYMRALPSFRLDALREFVRHEFPSQPFPDDAMLFPLLDWYVMCEIKRLRAEKKKTPVIVAAYMSWLNLVEDTNRRGKDAILADWLDGFNR